MNQDFTHWANATFSPSAEVELAGRVGDKPCPDPEGWLEMLTTILDNSADEATLDKFRTHVVDCLPCYKWYNLEYSVKKKLMELPRHHANHELVLKIKDMLNSENGHA